MNIIEYAAMIVIVGVIAALLAFAFEPKEPKELRAEDLGYMPGSEAPPWGWPLTILGTIAVIAIFIGLFGYVGSAVFL